MSRCRLCRIGELQSYLELPKSLRNISKLFTQTELLAGTNDSTINLTVYVCPACGFVQLGQRLEMDFYETYIMTSTHSTKAQNTQRYQALMLYQNTSGGRVLDVGCGDGSFLQALKQVGFTDVRGLEPSDTFSQHVSKEFIVYHEYLTAQTNLGPFDAVVSREVLEHVWDIHDFLEGIKRVLKPGGQCLIEVPRLEKAIQDNRFYDFFTDHVNYFSQQTLILLLQMHGFEVDLITTGMDEEYNVVLCHSKQLVKQLEPVQPLIKSILDLSCDSKKVFWGTGGKGLSILGYIGNYFDIIVDDDPHKIGLYTPVTHQLIQNPSELWDSHNDIGLILISAMAYADEIIAKINAHNYKGLIYVLGKVGVKRV